MQRRYYALDEGTKSLLSYIYYYVCFMLHFTREISFFLHLGNDHDSLCDPPDTLGQGVRLEVQERAGPWHPIRFYTSTTRRASESYVDQLNSTHIEVQDETGYTSVFPLYVNRSTSAMYLTEYVCARDFAGSRIRFRWKQHFAGHSRNDEDTWSLDDITIRLWNGSCYRTILHEDFEDIVQ